MPTDECHIHWDGRSAYSVINVLEQDLELVAKIDNSNTANTDPLGTIRVRLLGSVLTGLSLPTEGWQAIPGTSPVLEARMDGHYAIGYIRIRHA